MSGEEGLPVVVDAAPEVPEPAPEPAAELAAAADGGGAAPAAPAEEGGAATAAEDGNGDAKPADGAEAKPAASGEGGREGKDGQDGRDGALPSSRPPRVYFSGAPQGVRQEDVEEVFSYYGKVERAELFTNFQTKVTRGCGYVQYRHKQAADDAIAALAGAYTFPGGSAPMVVRYEEAPPERKRKAETEDPNEDRRQLFLAKITRSAPEEDIKAVLEHYGTVEKLSMFKPTPDAVWHKGCGVVTFASPEEAECAVRYLDEAYTWPGMKEPMVAKFNESDANKRRREDDMRFGPQYVSLEPPPHGCDGDALKLYVGNIPTAATVEEIRDELKGYGRIIQIHVQRDKDTGAPRGAAYIWFARRRDADFAIKRLNGSTAAFQEAWARQLAQQAEQEAGYGAAAGPAEAPGAAAAPAAEAGEAAAPAAEGGEGQPAAAAEEPAKPADEAAAAGGEAEQAGKEGGEGGEAKPAGEGAAAASKPKEASKPAGPKPLVVTIAQSSVQTLRPGERPPMRGAPGGFGGPPPFRPPYGGPPHGGWGPPPGAWGAPPPGAWGPPPPAYGGYGAPPAAAPYGGPPAQPGYGQPAPAGYGAAPAAAPAAAPGYGYQQPAAAPQGYQQAYQQAPAAAAPQATYQAPPQQYAAAPQPAAAPAYGQAPPAYGQQPAQAAGGYGYAQQAPAAQQQPAAGYGSYPQQQAGAPAPQQQQPGYGYGGGY